MGVLTMVSEIVKKGESDKLCELFEIKKNSEKIKGNSFNQHTIAKLGGWTQPNVSAYLRGKVELKEDSAAIFSEALGFPISIFSPRLYEKIKKRELLAGNPQLNKITISYVPKYKVDTLDAIKNHIKDVNYTMPMSDKTTPTTQDVSANSFSYDLEDNSLESTYSVGTTFIFDPSLTPRPTDIVLAAKLNAKNVFVIREYQVIDILENGDEVFELKPFNPAYPVIKSDYEVLGVAVVMQKNLR